MPSTAMMETFADVFQAQVQELGLLCDVASIIEQMKALSRSRGMSTEALADAHVSEMENLKKEHTAEMETVKRHHAEEVIGLAREHAMELRKLQRELSHKHAALEQQNVELTIKNQQLAQAASRARIAFPTYLNDKREDSGVLEALLEDEINYSTDSLTQGLQLQTRVLAFSDEVHLHWRNSLSLMRDFVRERRTKLEDVVSAFKTAPMRLNRQFKEVLKIIEEEVKITREASAELTMHITDVGDLGVSNHEALNGCMRNFMEERKVRVRTLFYFAEAFGVKLETSEAQALLE